MFYDAVANDHGLPQDPFKALVAPRPIGWISSLSADGIPNLAPFSYFNAMAQAPHYVAFGIGPPKDTLRNVEATGEFGRSCYLPSTFPSLLHAALKHGDDLPTALLECCRAGGDNASRCAVLGAWLGAVHGVRAIPAPWLERLAARTEIEALTERLLSAG